MGTLKMRWKASSERHAARMRLKNAQLPPILDQIGQFWDRVREDVKTAGYKHGPQSRQKIRQEVGEQLTIQGPMIEVKATRRG